MSGKRLSPSEERFLNFRPKTESDLGIPPPPYQVGNVHLKHIGIRFARGAARQLLPPELDPVEGESGLISVYSVGSGTGIAPFSACFVAAEVRGFDAPDGSAGYYIATGYYSGHGTAFMRRYYNLNALEGGSRQFRDADIAVGVGGPPESDVLDMRLRPSIIQPPFASGIRHYLGRRPGGGTCVFPIAFSGIIFDAEPISVEISDHASEKMRLARPAELTFALECTDMSLTFGLPQPIDEIGRLPDTAAQAALLDSFSRAGRAAVVVSAAGEVNVASAGAQTILGDGVSVVAGRICATHPEDHRALQSLLIAATAGDKGARDLAPIGIRRRSGHVLVVDAVPIGPAVTGRASVLLLLNDPATPVVGNPGPALQLLGLTPAEARIAELVGSGLSPRETAQRIENSEATVRTSLKRIYEKLDINRQSELARIVARLERRDAI